MENAPDYKKFAILHVDDDPDFLESLTIAHGHLFRILSARSAKEGLRLLEEHRTEIGVLLTDQRMPEEKGVWLLEQARRIDPRIVRILLTGYADYPEAIAAINSGAIYKYLHKDQGLLQELEQTLKQALDLFSLQRERDQLLHERSAVLRHMMMADRLASLSLLARGLSQHIRNPLTAVKTFFQLLPGELAREQEAGHAFRHPDFWVSFRQGAEAQLDKVDKLLAELWTAVQMATCNFTDEVNIRELARECLAAQAAGFQERDITVENDISAELPPVRGDRARLRLLLDRLLKDEQVSLPAGSRISLHAQLLANETSPAIEVLVMDNGPGLSDDDLRALLEPFALRSDVPTEYGIHLVGCHFIARGHGGSIEARRREGGGTVFAIRLPLDPERALTQVSQGDFETRLRNVEEAWQKSLRGEADESS